MPTFWAWREVGENLCEAPEIASGLTFSGAKAFGQGQRFTNILSNFLSLFLFKFPMAGMNRLFEQDPEFPHFGSREDQLAFYSAKIALSEEQKKSGSAPTAGGPIRKPRRSKAVLKLQYSKQCNSVKKSVVWNSSDDEPIFPHSMSDPDDNEPIFRRDKKPGDLTNSIVEPTPLAVNIHVRAQIQRIRQGATNVVLIRPLADANLATDVEMLVHECIKVPHVASVELQVSNSRPISRWIKNDLSCGQGTPLGAMDRRAFTAVGLLVREMRRNGRRIDFVGLTNTLLTDSDVLYLVGVLESLPRPPADSQMRPSPKLEIKQTTLSAPVRERLMAAGKYAGIDVRLSAPSGPASRF